MNILSKLLSVVKFALPLLCCMAHFVLASDKTMKVFILAGQSNAVGCNKMSDMTPAEQEDMLGQMEKWKDNITFWPGSNALAEVSNQWTTLQLGLSANGGKPRFERECFGPEIGIATRLAAQYPDTPIAIIKFALGGTGIARTADYEEKAPSGKGRSDKNVNWYPSSAGKERGMLYQDLLDNVKLALEGIQSQCRPYDIEAIFWMQGENDCNRSEQVAKDYKEHLSLFRDTLRRDLNLPHIPFIVGEINSCTWKHRALGMQSQLEAVEADKDSVLVKSADLPCGLSGGPAHYTASGMWILGQRFAEAYLHLKK